MTRPLPAHVVVGGAVLGLALSNAARLEPGTALAGGSIAAVAALLAFRQTPLVAAGVLALVLGWGWGSARLAAFDHSVLRSEIGRAGRFEVVTTGDARAGLFAQRQPGRARRFERHAVDERVELDLPLGRAPPQGAIISALAVIRAPRGAVNGFDERRWLRRQGIHVVLHVDEWHVVGHRGGVGGVADRLRAWLRRACAPRLTGERRAVLEGIVLGDDAGLSAGLKTSFRRAGLYHLLAVSGQNVVLIAFGALGLCVLAGLPRPVGHLAALAAIGAYVLAVGPQASVIRAAVSGVTVSVAWLAARESERWHTLLLAALVLLAWSPYELFDPGFQLSFAAVLAIFVAAGPLLRMLEGYPLPPSLAGAAAISAACGVATAPILWLQFGQVPLLGVVANVLVEPVVGILLGLGLVTACVDLVDPAAAAALASLNGWIAAYVAGCARGVAAAPFAQASGPAAAAAGVGAIGAAAYAWQRWRTSFNRPT